MANTIQSVGEFIGKHGAEFTLLVQAISAVLGKGGDKENLPPEIQRVAGLFGSGDEIKFVNAVINELDLDEQGKPKRIKKEQDILLGLINYHFGPFDQPRSWLKFLIVLAQTNKWRKIITELDSPTQKMGTKKVVTSEKLPGFSADDESLDTGDTDDQQNSQAGDNQNQRRRQQKKAPVNTKTTTEQQDVYSTPKGNTVKFLKRIVEIVEDGEEQAPKSLSKVKRRQRGYDAAIAYMRSLGLPLMPRKETLDWFESRIPALFSKAKQVDAAVIAQANLNRTREEQMHPVRRWFRNLL